MLKNQLRLVAAPQGRAVPQGDATIVDPPVKEDKMLNAS